MLVFPILMNVFDLSLTKWKERSCSDGSFQSFSFEQLNYFQKTDLSRSDVLW